MATADLTASRLRELESLPGEVWRPVLGYEDRYRVSNIGRVKLLACRLNTWFGTRARPEQIMVVRADKAGYIKVCLQRDLKQKHTHVHVVVLKAFVGEPQQGQEARHLNGIRGDNRPENLAWGTHLENMRDQYLHGTRAIANSHPASKVTRAMVSNIRSSTKTIALLAKEMNLGTSTVWRIRRGYSDATLLGDTPSA